MLGSWSGCDPLRASRAFEPSESTHRSNVLYPPSLPLLARDLTRLPVAHIMIAGSDPLRDDGTRYAHRLRHAGVEVTLALHEGHIQGSGRFTAVMETARSWRDEIIATLVQAHAAGRPALDADGGSTASSTT